MPVDFSTKENPWLTVTRVCVKELSNSSETQIAARNSSMPVRSSHERNGLDSMV
jgi:hypothetical protein